MRRDTINLRRSTHLLALITIGVGGWWCFIILSDLISRAWTTGLDNLTAWFWLELGFALAFILPGGLALIYGAGLFRKVSGERIKGSVGILAIFGAFLSAAYIDKLLPWRDSMLSLLISTVLMIIAYVWICARLFRTENLKIEEDDGFIGTGILTLLSILIWLSLSELLSKHYASSGLWVTIAPILVACLFYKLTTKTLLKEEDQPSESINEEDATDQNQTA